ncbi:WhiB family transcriptional regulator [Streptomyces sp. MS06]|uniref:WhiB family transcriptional regulator n=1 Tax=Streptomyces sp. MS06 TaxID=3385974 RepID=UPI0039A0B9C9
MTTATHATWREQAACAGHNTSRWYPAGGTATAAALAICAGCPVRAECLHEALRLEPRDGRFGVWGGLTATERRQLQASREPTDMTVSALRRLLDEIDAQGGPDAARHGRLNLTDTPEGPDDMAQPIHQLADMPEPALAAAPAPPPRGIPVGQLLKWGDQHQDPDVQAQAARARAALTGLRQRHAADQELAAITSETAELEQRLAELRAREQELAPAKPRKKRAAPVRDYDTREVRAWAAANGVDCPRMGQLPKRVLDAWRARPEAADA